MQNLSKSYKLMTKNFIFGQFMSQNFMIGFNPLLQSKALMNYQIKCFASTEVKLPIQQVQVQNRLNKNENIHSQKQRQGGATGLKSSQSQMQTQRRVSDLKQDLMDRNQQPKLSFKQNQQQKLRQTNRHSQTNPKNAYYHQKQIENQAAEYDEDNSLHEVISIESIQTCFEYTQSLKYLNNNKTEKALKLLEGLSQLLRFHQFNSPGHLLVQQKLYQCLIMMGRIKDAEMMLLNMIQGMVPNSKTQYDSAGLILAKIDYLIHMINFQEQETGPRRIIKLGQEILKLPQFQSLSDDQSAYTRFVIGTAFFLSEKVSYTESKFHLKYALKTATDDKLRSIILHNLAVMNYCEISDHNDRMLNPSKIDKEDVLEQMNKEDKRKAEEKEENLNIRRQLSKQEKEKRNQERIKMVREKLKMGQTQFFDQIKTKQKGNTNQRIYSILGKIMQKETDKQQKQLSKIQKVQQEVDSAWKQDFDLLENSILPKEAFVDPLKFGTDPKRIDPSISLPRRTIENLNLMMVDRAIDFDPYTSFNEILPQLFLSLRYSYYHLQKSQLEDKNSANNQQTEQQKYDPFIHCHKIDDLMNKQNAIDQIKNIKYHKTIEFVARMYAQDSKRYQVQSEFWLNALEDLLYDLSIKDIYNTSIQPQLEMLSRRCQILQAAYYIDNRKIKLALDSLNYLVTQNFDPKGGEKDTEALVNSLLGILKQNSKNHDVQLEGLAHLEKAKEISKEMGALYERKKWLIIPSIDLSTK
ncbi:UNKNOWN [Stylonychia lemnae]|uniref:Uncharacterized protein n=1 Tax=Stylonychia lemnae TaxID=5949 RepID=A0A078B2Z4_STYLE|nr:UNKNOWN [Stylonychia lemnae]|eukprot:CDW87612.1 UNKNOWN [Stylonychia lemnae]